MVPIWYASLTEVQRAADIPSSALYDARVSNVLTQATDSVREACNRDFEPTLATRWFPWPQDQTQSPRRLLLGRNTLISMSAVVNGDGTAMDLADLKLVKVKTGDDGPPYNAIESAIAFCANTQFPSRSIGITGLYGYRNDEWAITTTVSDVSGTTVDVADSSQIGVGSIIRIGDERLVVRRRGWLNSGNAATINIDASESSDFFNVTDGTDYAPGELILIDSEQMEITDVAGNMLIVERAVNGSVLAAHTGVTLVNVNRRLTVQRGVLDTTSVATLSGATVNLFQFPGMVAQLCKGEALQIIAQDLASYGSRAGSGQGEMSMAVRAVPELRSRVIGRYGRLRSGAV